MSIMQPKECRLRDRECKMSRKRPGAPPGRACLRPGDRCRFAVGSLDPRTTRLKGVGGRWECWAGIWAENGRGEVSEQVSERGVK